MPQPQTLNCVITDLRKAIFWQGPGDSQRFKPLRETDAVSSLFKLIKKKHYVIQANAWRRARPDANVTLGVDPKPNAQRNTRHRAYGPAHIVCNSTLSFLKIEACSFHQKCLNFFLRFHRNYIGPRVSLYAYVRNLHDIMTVLSISERRTGAVFYKLT